MHVSVDETGYDGASTAVDHSCAAADVRLHVVIRSDRDEPAVADRERRDLAKAVVDRQDLRIAQHEIGLSRSSVSESRGRRRGLIRLRQHGNERGQRDAGTELRDHLWYRST